MGIAFEELGDLNTAFDMFRKWYGVCQDLYGMEHAKSKRPISTLNESAYKEIAFERGIPIPSLASDTSEAIWPNDLS